MHKKPIAHKGGCRAHTVGVEVEELLMCRRSSFRWGGGGWGDEPNRGVDRVPGFLSSRPNWLPQASVVPHPL